MYINQIDSIQQDRFEVADLSPPLETYMEFGICTYRAPIYVRFWRRLPPTLGDVEATARRVPVLTAFFYRNTYNFGKKRFYNQAGFRVVSSGRGKRTTVPINS
jgi:hypothetical protein